MKEKNVQIILILNLLLLGALAVLVITFWSFLCSSEVNKCLPDQPFFKELAFFAISLIRPLTLTPLFQVSRLVGDSYGYLTSIFLIASGAALSSIFVHFIGKFIGERWIQSWIKANLPATWNFMKTQDYKIVIFLRLLPLPIFDLLSFLFGVLDFSVKRTFYATFIAILPESILYTAFLKDNLSLTIPYVLIILFFIGFEVSKYRKKKTSSIIIASRALWKEFQTEILTSNSLNMDGMEIPENIDKTKRPVLLLYGFFSSHASLALMQKNLIDNGFPVISFNLSGFLNIYNTSSINTLSKKVQTKIKEIEALYGIDKIDVIAFSKGGLVAMDWLLNEGGDQFINRLITMGSPFKGSNLAYFGLMTPIGFFFKDMWDFRPGSSVVHSISNGVLKSPVEIYSFFSKKDGVTGESAKLSFVSPQKVSYILEYREIMDASHFDFLISKNVFIEILKILNQKSKVKS